MSTRARRCLIGSDEDPCRILNGRQAKYGPSGCSPSLLTRWRDGDEADYLAGGVEWSGLVYRRRHSDLPVFETVVACAAEYGDRASA